MCWLKPGPDAAGCICYIVCMAYASFCISKNQNSFYLLKKNKTKNLASTFSDKRLWSCRECLSPLHPQCIETYCVWWVQGKEMEKWNESMSCDPWSMLASHPTCHQGPGTLLPPPLRCLSVEASKLLPQHLPLSSSMLTPVLEDPALWPAGLRWMWR